MTTSLRLLARLSPIAMSTAALVAIGGCSAASPHAIDADASSPATPAESGSDAGSPGLDGARRADAAGVADDAHVTVQGWMGGPPFVAKGAAARPFGWNVRDPGVGPGLSFAIGDYPSMCTSSCVAGSRAIYFYLRGNGKSWSGDGFAPFPTGTYPLVEDATQGGRGAAPQGTVLTLDLYPGCGLTAPQPAKGSVTITASSVTSVTGSFEVVSASHGTITGTFVVPICGDSEVAHCANGTRSDANSIVCAL